MSKRYCLTVDLKDDAYLIQEYEEHHKAVWPEIIESIKDAGIIDMEIYRLGNRLFMTMEVNDEFSFDRKQQLDEGNAKVQEWEELMWKYQQPLAIATKGEKWVLMKNIFTLKDF
jgi:L-rhamnose mutarotase